MSARDWCNTILSFIGGVIPELIGAAVGVYGGYLYGLRQERRVREENEKERKEDMIKSLILEVADIKMSLDKRIKQKHIGTTNVNYIDSPLFTDAFNSTIFSGGYQLLTGETQRVATWYFRGCKKMNRLLERLEYSETSEKELRNISAEILKMHYWLKERTSELLPKLEEELGYTWVIKIG